MIRRLHREDLPGLMRLYSFFHPDKITPDEKNASVQRTWSTILSDPNQRYFGAEIEGQLVSTCLLTLIPNLTHGCRSYGLIENVITDPDWRNRGLARQVLNHALNTAWQEDCYKVMLLTGSKTESTLRFYEKSGFKPNLKTGFVAYPPDYPSG